MRPLLTIVCAATVVVSATVGFTQPASAQQVAPQFKVTLDTESADGVYSGRLFVLMSKRGNPQPITGPAWIKPEPFFAIDVAKMKRGDSQTLDDSAAHCPVKLSSVPAGKYFVQAILDHEFYSSTPHQGEGNFYSAVAEVDFDPETTGVIDLSTSKVIAPRKFPESKHLKKVSIKSALLSKFFDRDVEQSVAVKLPPDYFEKPNHRFPVLFVFGGFSGTIEVMPRFYSNGPYAIKDTDEVQFIRVFVSGECKWGNHVCANSATNGPRGDAFVKEIVPHIDANFRTVADPRARFLTGHSSGGWASLWLQVNYPDSFGGVWSTAPDPVDFRDYQQVNLYAETPHNMYVDQKGDPRPIARAGDRVLMLYEDFTMRDDVVARGGQLRSFEAVFSDLGDDGLPKTLWDRETGTVDPEVAKSWRAYDIRLIVEQNWESLKHKLGGKIHVTMGTLDTFYLNGATELLGESLKLLGSDAEIEMVEGKNHSNVITPDLREKHARQMADAYLKYYQADGSEK